LIDIEVEPEYRYVSRSLSKQGPEGEPDAPIIVEREIMDLLRWLKRI
jgi:hypothetical protein